MQTHALSHTYMYSLSNLLLHIAIKYGVCSAQTHRTIAAQLNTWNYPSLASLLHPLSFSVFLSHTHRFSYTPNFTPFCINELFCSKICTSSSWKNTHASLSPFPHFLSPTLIYTHTGLTLQTSLHRLSFLPMNLDFIFLFLCLSLSLFLSLK